MKFKRILIDRKSGQCLNTGYLPYVIFFYEKYSKYLNDDYFDMQSQSIINKIINIIEKTSPYFWVITNGENDEFAGFVFLDNLVGIGKTLHSAELTTCFSPKYWGAFTKVCAKKFLRYCFKNYGLKKIKACIFPQNLRVRNLLKQSGFKSEGVLKSETLRGGKLQDVEVFGCFPEKNFEKS